MRRGPDVHVTLRWGRAVVRTKRVSAAEPLVLGAGEWSLPDESIGALPYTLLRPEGDGEAAAREAEAFGIIGLLDTGPAASPDAPLVTWGRDASVARDPASSRAPLWGATIHDAFAWGGIGLTGVGEGGGGRAEAIGLGGIGVLGLGAGTGPGDAFGPGGFGGGGTGESGGGVGQGIGLGSFGTLGHGSGGFTFDRGFLSDVHGVKAPRIRIVDGGPGPTAGRLPPEAIQRVVRQNMGRFRLCYQRGLDKQPGLRGRVVTRFLIVRDGTVPFAADDGSNMLDASVTACVVRTFTALAFPEPTGGTVSVIYPFTFEPE